MDEACKRRDDRFRRESDQSLREQALSPKATGSEALGGSGEYPSRLTRGGSSRAEDKDIGPLPRTGARQGLTHQRWHRPLPVLVAFYHQLLGPLFSLKIARSDTQERSYCNSVDSGKGTGRCRAISAKRDSDAGTVRRKDRRNCSPSTTGRDRTQRSLHARLRHLWRSRSLRHHLFSVFPVSLPPTR